MTDVQVRAGSENAAEYGVIARSVNRVRRKLWLVRAVERGVLGLAWGAGAGLFFVGARLVVDWSEWASVGIAVVPALVAGWMWREARTARGVVATTFIMRLFAVLTVVLAGGTVGALMSAGTMHGAAWIFAAVPLGVFVLAGAATVRAVDAKAAAIFIDQQVGLKERVSTALDFLQVAPASPMEAAFRQPVLASAVEACNSVGKAKIGYARADQRLYATAATVAIAAVAVSFVTPLPASANTSQKQYAQVVEKSKKLEKILEELAQKPEEKNEEAQTKLKPLKNTLAELKKGTISPFEAEERLSEERAELQKEKDKEDAMDRVEKALDNIKDMEAVKQAADEMKKGASAHADGQSGAGEAKGDQALKDATGALGNKLNSGGMSKEDKEKLQKGLEKAAENATGAPDLKESLQRASDAVKKNDGGGLASNLNQAGQAMAKGGGSLSGQELKDAMDAIDRANAGGRGGDEDRARQGSGGNSDNQSASNQQDGGQGEQGGGQQGGGQQGGGQQGGGQQGGGQQGQQGGAGQQGGGQQGGSQAASGQQNSSSGQGSGGQTSMSGGSTNMHAPSGPGDHNSGKPVGGSESYVRVYDEQRTQTQGETEKVSGQINPLAPASGTIHVMGQGEKADPTIQTYESQLPAARKRAMDDLQTQQIPPQYRDLIREAYNH